MNQHQVRNRKTGFTLIIFVLSLLICTPQTSLAMDTHVGGDVAGITRAAVNFRECPSLQCGIMTTLGRGRRLRLIGRNKACTWVKAEIENDPATYGLGWISARYVKNLAGGGVCSLRILG